MSQPNERLTHALYVCLFAYYFRILIQMIRRDGASISFIEELSST